MRNAVIRKKRLRTGQLLYEYWMRSEHERADIRRRNYEFLDSISELGSDDIPFVKTPTDRDRGAA